MITHHDRPQAPNGFTWELHCDRCGAVLPSPRAWPSHLLTKDCVDSGAEQPDLEGRGPLDQPGAKVAADASETSLEAARRAAKVSGGHRRRILGELIGAGPDGLTDLELTDRLDMNPSTVRPRRLELVEAGYVEDNGLRGDTPSGGTATCWSATRDGQRAWREQRPDQ